MSNTYNERPVYALDGWYGVLLVFLFGWGSLQLWMFLLNEPQVLDSLPGWLVGLAWVAAALGAFLTVVGMMGFRTVREGSHAVCTRFGRYRGVISQGGFYWLIPPVSLTVVPMGSRQYEPDRVEVEDLAGIPQACPGPHEVAV